MSSLARHKVESLIPTRKFSLDKRIFTPVDNSTGGLVDARTRFHFWQNGDAFFADYFGGDVREGHIIGRFTSDRTGTMLYHCLTKDRRLKAGRAVATFNLSDEGRASMALEWVWVSGADGSGTSHYEEITGNGWNF